MSFERRICRLEMDYGIFTRFLLSNYDELNMPYPFSMSLSFMASPMVLGQAVLVYREDPYEAVGAFGFVYGTGEHQYEDRRICQIAIAFLKEQYQRTPLLLVCMRELLKIIENGNAETEEIQFWISSNHPGARLFARLGQLQSATCETGQGDMLLYRIPIHSMKAYCRVKQTKSCE